ncbi:MAG TPA: SRPBCC family protein, partial [Rhodothermales bacterium]|nr:SRPBCC family protein [Rhodothermales bacterium]
ARDYAVREIGAIEGGNQTLNRFGKYLAERVGGNDSSSPAVVRVSRSFAAPAERVFDAWIDPASISQWMFGPALRDEEVLHIQTEPRVGGRFSFLVRRQGDEIDHVGTYREVDRPRRLAFTWGIVGLSEDESVVTVEIRPANGGCELTLTHEKVWAAYAARTEEGWATMLDAMATYFASTRKA